MVGFYLPENNEWEEHVIEFNQLLGNNLLRLFSFELKKALTKGNYREAFFQALSKSSWANEGYLVAAEIIQDDELLSELERLSASFGIGIIQLDPMDIDSSSVLYPAHEKDRLDWEAINKLSDKNPEFRNFIKNVTMDLQCKYIHSAQYDEVKGKNIYEYIRKIFGTSR